jgi:hypothetical protein
MRDAETTRKIKTSFLKRLACCGSLPEARAGLVGRSTVFRWRRADPDFRAAFAEAISVYIEKLDAEVDRPAVKGVASGACHHGKE